MGAEARLWSQFWSSVPELGKTPTIIDKGRRQIAQGKARIEKTCSRCRASWVTEEDIEAAAEGPGARKEALRKLEEMIRKRCAAGQPDRNVVCPKCGHFSTDAVAKHFSAGYQKGALQHYRNEMEASFLGTVFAAALTTGGIAGALLISKASTAGAVVLGIVAVFLGGIAVSLGREAIRSLAAYPRVKGAIQGAGADDLVKWLLDAYEQNGNSLVGRKWTVVLRERCAANT